MEFPFSINVLFHREVTILDNRLMLFAQKCRHGQSSSEAYKQVCTVIDKLGEGSAKAQGLPAVITTARKLEFSDHRLYIVKDADCNDGKGAVVGIIKVGPKRLFVYDRQGNQHEVDAHCVLDFYVHESRQRSGYGKKLFESMLQTESVTPDHLAIDRPSHKFSAFLSKHYGLKAPIPQQNNFALFDGFFKNRHDISNKRQGKAKLHLYKGNNSNSVLPHPAVEALWNVPDTGRQSSLSNSNVPLTDCEKEKDLLKDIPLPKADSSDNINALNRGPMQRSNSLSNDLKTLALDDRRGLAAQGSRYSRYEAMATPPSKPSSAGQKATPGGEMDMNRKESSPPPLRRDGPPKDYLSLNTHRDYQTRQGHLRVTSGASSSYNHSSQPQGGVGDAKNSPIGGSTGQNWHASTVNTPPAKDLKNESPWYAAPTNHSAKKYQRTRLW